MDQALLKNANFATSLNILMVRKVSFLSRNPPNSVYKQNLLKEKK